MNVVIDITKCHNSPCCHYIDFLDGDIERTALFCDAGGKFNIDGVVQERPGDTLGQVIDWINANYETPKGLPPPPSSYPTDASCCP